MQCRLPSAFCRLPSAVCCLLSAFCCLPGSATSVLRHLLNIRHGAPEMACALPILSTLLSLLRTEVSNGNLETKVGNDIHVQTCNSAWLCTQVRTILRMLTPVSSGRMYNERAVFILATRLPFSKSSDLLFSRWRAFSST